MAATGTTVSVMAETAAVEAAALEEPAPNAPLSVPFAEYAPPVGAALPPVPVPQVW